MPSNEERPVETSLYYITSRYYDPEIGQFISTDGIEYLSMDNISGIHLYAYCQNNPVMNYDVNGHSWESFWKPVGDWFQNVFSNFFTPSSIFVKSIINEIILSIITPATNIQIEANNTIPTIANTL